jgi:hypothetical protein
MPDAKKGREGEIDVGDFDFLDGSLEFARLWSEPEGEQTFIIEPSALGADPALFGMAMVDCIRHAAIAYSRAVNISEEHALQRILQGFQAELSNPTDEPQPLGDGGEPN